MPSQSARISSMASPTLRPSSGSPEDWRGTGRRMGWQAAPPSTAAMYFSPTAWKGWGPSNFTSQGMPTTGRFGKFRVMPSRATTSPPQQVKAGMEKTGYAGGSARAERGALFVLKHEKRIVGTHTGLHVTQRDGCLKAL